MDNIQEIKSRLDIVDVLSGYIRLTPAGPANFRAICPFHNEKTPSFMVSREKQIWKCFGCGKGGSIFDFVMEMEGVEFKDALRILAGKAGVELKKQDPQLTSQRNRTLDCLDAASRFFYQVLLNADVAKSAREYLKNRTIDDCAIDEFKIGFAPNSWDSLYNALRKKVFFASDMEKAGLIIKKQGGNDYYDRFRNRIMFPIRDINGNVVAFSGRILEMPKVETRHCLVSTAKGMGNTPTAPSGTNEAKYINSPQTIVFDKSKIIYALDKAKQEIRKNDLAVIVEGQMDVIACHQAGYKNVVGSSGTALTTEHIKTIKRYTNNIALCFDQDEAGKNAARRAVDLALEAEINIKIIKIEGTKDPDECIKKSPDLWEKAVKTAKNYVDHYFEEIFSEFDASSIEGKKNISKNLLPLLSKIEDKITQTHYLQKLAAHLNVGEDVLRETIAKTKNIIKRETKPIASPLSHKKDKNLFMAERIISLSLIYIENFSFVIDHMMPEFITNDKLNLLYKELIIFYTKNRDELMKSGKLDIDKFTEDLSLPLEKDEFERYLKELWLCGEKEILEYREGGETVSAPKIKIEVAKGILWLRDRYNKNRLSALQMEIKKAEDSNDKEIVESLSKEVIRIIGEMK
ncbi:MAG: DNA primase [bacterium]